MQLAPCPITFLLHCAQYEFSQISSPIVIFHSWSYLYKCGNSEENSLLLPFFDLKTYQIKVFEVEFPCQFPI